MTPQEPSQLAADILKRLVPAAEEDRKAWLRRGDEIERYTTSDDYGFLYQDFPAEQSLWARVNKASEFQQILGPYLYPNNPDATVNSQPWADPWAKQRHQVEEQYVDYAAKHGDLATHMKRAVDHALVYGRAPLWTGYNSRKRVVQNIFDRCDHLVLDPDAKNSEEINWGGRKRIKPRWELRQLYPDKASIIDRLPVYTPPNSAGKDKRTVDSSSDLVCYYEVWMGVGIQNYAPSLEAVQADAADIQSKKKYCFADGHVLHESDWEIPFFMLDMWPWENLDLLERPGQLWPLQPMEPGMGHLRTMNKLYTTFIAKYFLMSRTPFVALEIGGNTIPLDQLYKILQGEHIDILKVKISSSDDNYDINKLFQRIDWGDPVPGFDRIWAITTQEFEKATGLAEVLYSGMTPTQLRSAKAADLVESNSKNRSEAMRERTAQFMEKIFRKTLFAARYLESSEDIGKLFGPQAGPIWGELGPPEAVAQEQAFRAQMGQMVGEQMAMMGQQPDPAAIDQQMGPPQFVDMDSWIMEADRTIDAGSMRRLDIDAQVANLNVALNQLGPSVISMPGGAEFVGALAQEFTKINRFSPELQAAAAQIPIRIAEAQAMQAMMGVPPGQPGAPSPEKGPQTGPTGGEAPPA